MTYSKRERSEEASKSPFVAVTSVVASNGFLSLLLFSLLLLGSAFVYASSSEVYEAFKALPLWLQFSYVTWASVFAIGYAVTMREMFSDRMIRIAARVAGVGGVAALVGLSFHMTMQADRLQHQLTAKVAKHARQIATHEPQGPKQADSTLVAGTTKTFKLPSGKAITVSQPFDWRAAGSGIVSRGTHGGGGVACEYGEPTESDRSPASTSGAGSKSAHRTSGNLSGMPCSKWSVMGSDDR